MFDKMFDNNTMHWRVRQMDRNVKRLKWELKRRFAHSATETVDKFSMVVVGRNDNYGGDFTERLKATIDWNYKHIPGCELIYIEWNSIEDRPSDTGWISERYPNSKCFIVPNAIHQDYCASPKIPVMEYFAKNLGIREASNEWILCVNADVFLGHNTFKNMRQLNKGYMYGSHYNNILWDGAEILDKYITDKKYTLNVFAASKLMRAVVGNFVLTHRNNWELSKGYDEQQKSTRLGMDQNGAMMLYHKGVKPMVIGDHYHLDHNESAIKGGVNATHGEQSIIKSLANIPYDNGPDWGLAKYPKVEIADRIWQLQKI